MAFAAPIAMLATLVGGGITAFGKYQAGEAASRADAAQAQVEQQLSRRLALTGDTTEYAGFRAAEDVGLQTRAGIGRQAVEFAAGNVAGRSPADIRASQIALGAQSAREKLAGYQYTAEQERLGAAEKAAAAGRYQFAAMQDVRAGDIGAAGAAVSAIGESTAVASKWYQTAPSAPSSSVYG